MAKNYEPIPLVDPETGKKWQLRPNKLVMDSRDLLLRSVRQNLIRKPWDKMSEKEQQLEVNRCEETALALVQAVVEIVAAAENDVVHAIIDSFKIKDGKVQITSSGLAEDGVLLSLNHAGKKAVKIIVTDAEQFDETREAVQVDKDEPKLFEDEEEEEENPAEPEFDDNDRDPSTDQNQEPEPEEDEDPELPPEDQGKGMAEHGAKANANPFPAGTREHDQWLAGFNSINTNGETVEEDEPDFDPETGEISEGDQEDEDTETSLGDAAASVIESDEDAGGEDEPWEPSDLDVDEARQEGIEARKDGAAPSKNPYNGGKLAESWLEGYEEEKAEEARRDNTNDDDAQFED